ncbi:unnamed protein product [Tilletia controversa]|uniref:Protein LTV1 n=1 Tax=Tilletia caries TaxID=13290 RepID=A0A177V6B5_9BASI|nr:hypothetical protein CF336_g5467 [Tilletia laevis]KAE8247634.1 hypothetical protein A4X03_0g6994 [Tilletia caries]CAD6921084.1 unnamed protein product [Tilletia controversa]KAE8197031.1 hypothetical protein CF335_g4713 [Tilletia laevis]CAD6937087.1 unnamed protein product [Tilletia controversa]
MAPSIWRSKEAQHFQVVHRSQRDPLINDPLAGDRVLKQVSRPNAATTRADLEAADPDLAKETRQNIGEASLYGIYLDDTTYDYMKHLRVIQGDFNSKRGGEDEPEEVATILLNAKPNRQEQKRQQKAQGAITLKEDESASKTLDLPADVLPPQESTMRKNDYADQLDVNPSIAGLQPDMDPHLRQALEALDDEAFLTLGGKKGDASTKAAEEAAAAAAKEAAEAEEAEEEDPDDFFNQILAGGEVAESEFGVEDGPEAEDWRALPPGGDEQMWQPHTWTAAQMAAIKQSREAQQQQDGDRTKASGSTPQARVGVARSRMSAGTATSSIFSATSKRKPGQRARLAASVAPSLNDGRTEWSMTSSSMRRNKGLSTLDDQFEALQRRYDDEEGFNEEDEDEAFDDEDDDEDADAVSASGSSAHPDVAAHHDAVFDKFLSSSELVGRRFEEALGPAGVHSTPSDKLGAWREGLGPLEEKYRLAALERKEGDDLPAESDPTFPWRREPKSSRQTWDVETILSTHSNLSNHPRLIRARDAASVAGTATTTHKGPSIIAEPKTARDVEEPAIANGSRSSRDEEEEDSDYESDATEVPLNVTITRDRNETAEEKKARKTATKEAKQARRQQKSARKAAFADEHKRQVHMASARTAGGGAADVGRNGIPLSGGRAAITL